MPAGLVELVDYYMYSASAFITFVCLCHLVSFFIGK